MTLTEQQIKTISERPLNDTLIRFQVKLRDLKSDHVWQEDIASLLGALVVSPAAFSLTSPNNAGSVAARLLYIAQLVRGGGLMLEQFRPLISSIVDNSPDVDIWDAVLNLIETLGPLTPPSSIVPTYKGTPVKTSSSRLADSEIRDIVEKELFFEIKDCVYRNVQGFWDKFFNSTSWCKERKRMLRDILEAHDGKKWRDFPSDPDEKPVWAWLRSLEESCLSDAPNKLHTTRTANQFKERKGQMDLFFQRPAKKDDGTFYYKDVLVVGEQKKSVGKFKATLLQLTRYVRGVFADQPTRRFVHSFTLCASTMELWVFDRSGLYSSGVFDIHAEPDKFARALVGYATMDDEMMGLDTFIDRKKGHHYATFRDKNGKEARIELKELLVRQRAVVCRGTTCYRTRNGHVAKLSWASDKRKPEAEHLELAAARGVKGVARVEAYYHITTITDMRKGLVFPKPHRFQDFEEASSHDIATINFKDKPAADSQSINRSSLKHKSSSDDTPRSKRSRSNSQKSNPIHQVDEQRSNDKVKSSLYISTPEDAFENRIYSCLVVSPAGRVISDFTSIKELLEALRDAIRAHQSLYIAGNILHRDISSNNIIITDPTIADGYKGMLIDLDLAKVKDSGPSGARHQTGTMQFMAIEVLRKVDHTYRHDLESFFYVLLWMCARCSWANMFGEEKPPRASLLRKWEIGSFSDIADAKEGHMTVNGLKRVMNEFPETFNIVKPLFLKIRKILFPLDEDEGINIGTPAGNPNQLYNAIINTYDEAIDKLSEH